MSFEDRYEIIGPLCYRGKEGCQHVLCTRMPGAESCYGYHCSYCDEPCSSQGHRCDASVTLLAEAKRLRGTEG